MKWESLWGPAGFVTLLFCAALVALRWTMIRHDRLLGARFERCCVEMRRAVEAVHEGGARCAQNTARELQTLRDQVQQKYAPREELAQLMLGAAALRDAIAEVREELRTLGARSAGTRELLIRVERQVDMLQEHVTAREAKL